MSQIVQSDETGGGAGFWPWFPLLGLANCQLPFAILQP
jgi:hypothetical protein